MSEQPEARRRIRRDVGTALALGLAAFLVLVAGVSSEPHFVDESAYYSQSGYADLLLSDRNAAAWLDYAGYDLPPLPKYLIGWSLRAFGFPRPNPRVAWAWYANTSRRFETPDSLVAARLPSAILGAVGCVAIYALGALAVDRWTGLGAAVLLLLNPLYRIHARRAMSDVPAEAFLLVSLALGGWAVVRILRDRRWSGMGLTLAAGVAVGLSVLCKLNGAIAGLILASWAGLTLVLPTRTVESPAGDFPLPSLRSKRVAFASIVRAAAVAFGVFVALNPFLTAQPPLPVESRIAPVAAMSFGDRVATVAKHRAEASRSGQASFPEYALRTPVDKITAVAVQGFGRFGPFGPSHSNSRIRFDPNQDSGALIWGAVVLLGLVMLTVRGRAELKERRFPFAWLVVLHAVVALVVVTAYIPLAWDRYYLSIQPGFCLAGSAAAVGFVRFAKGRLFR